MENILFAIAVAIPLLVALITLHEFGHFVTAKIFGMKVLEFGIGFPPRVWGYYTGRTLVMLSPETEFIGAQSFKQKQRVVVWSKEDDHGDLEAVIIATPRSAKSLEPDGNLLRHEGKVRLISDNSVVLADMIYSINLLPFGGFVRPAGDGDVSVPRSMESKPPWQRLIVLVAGVVVNLALVPLLFAAIILLPHDITTGYIEVVDVVSDGAAYGSLFQGDVIVGMNGVPLNEAGPGHLMFELQRGRGSEVILNLRRDDTYRTVALIPKFTATEGGSIWTIGIKFDIVETVTRRSSMSLPNAMMESMKRTRDLGSLTGGALIDSAASGTNPLSGPVGIVDIVGETSRNLGFRGWLFMGALLSFGLACFNILPIPAVDGGRAVFVIVEWICGKRLPQKFEIIVNRIGMGIIFVILILVTFGDITRITEIDIDSTTLLIAIVVGIALGISVPIAFKVYARLRAR